MKKLTLGFLFAALVVGVVSLYGVKAATADEATSPGNKRLPAVVKERMEDKKGQLAQRQENAQDKVERVRKSVGVRVDAYNRIIGHAEKILDKLQLRIDKAKQAGKDMTEAQVLMSEARAKVVDAKAKLADIESKKGTAMDKASFLQIQRQFQAIQQDLKGIKRDASGIISILRGFNSATSEGKNPQKEGTNPASSSSLNK